MTVARLACVALLAVAAGSEAVQGLDSTNNGAACYDFNSHTVYCAAEEESCLAGNTESPNSYMFFEQGYVYQGCCLCCNGCDTSEETGEDCPSKYGFDGECGHEGGPTEGSIFSEIGDGDNAGSCYNAADHSVYCAVDETTCLAGNANSSFPYQQYHWYGEGYVSSGSGCCHCCGGCNHTEESGEECELAYYPDGECGHEGGPAEDSPYYVAEEAEIGEGDNAGSCYSTIDHSVWCAVDEATCLAGNTETSYQYAWYPAGYISTAVQSAGAGCCHCCGGCNHTEETGEECEAAYYSDGECGHEGGPSADSPYASATPSSGARTFVAASLVVVVATFMF